MIRNNSTLLKRSALALLLAVLMAGGYVAYMRFASQSSMMEVEPVQTARATVGDLVLYADGTGTVMPTAESDLGFNSSGQVTKIDVKVGDTVEAGQILAQLDDTDATIQLAEAQEAMNALTSAAAIAEAKASLAAAQTEFDTAKEVLAYLISPEVLYWEEKVLEREQTLADAQTATTTDTSDAAKQAVTDAETSLTYAQTQLKYFQTVYEETYIPRNFTQYRTMRSPRGTRTEVIKVTDEETGETYDLIYPPTEGEIGMARADYDLAKASVAEAQIYLDTLNGEEIPEGATGSDLVTYFEAKHALETAQQNLEATMLAAPFNGTVTAIDMNVGDLVGSDPVITISNLEQPYALDAYLEADDWGAVKAGYAVDVTFDILPDQVFSGVVTNVYPTLDTESSNSALIHITAKLNDVIPYDIPTGAAASVDVIGGKTENAVLVPVESLHQIGEDTYTLFVMQNGTLRLRVVEVGLQDLRKAEIISGLNAGEVVTTGLVETK